MLNRTSCSVQKFNQRVSYQLFHSNYQTHEHNSESENPNDENNNSNNENSENEEDMTQRDYIFAPVFHPVLIMRTLLKLSKCGQENCILVQEFLNQNPKLS
eukprot:UN25866